jgi:hypothetical protein
MAKSIETPVTKHLSRISAKEFEVVLDRFEIRSEHKEIIMDKFSDFTEDIHTRGSAYCFYTNPLKHYWNDHINHKTHLIHDNDLFKADQLLRKAGAQRMLNPVELTLSFPALPDQRLISGPFVHEGHLQVFIVGENAPDDIKKYYGVTVPMSRLHEKEDTQILFAEIALM